MIARPAAYQLAARKRLLSRLETSLNATLSDSLPTAEQLAAQLDCLNAIFLDGIASLDGRDVSRALRAQAHFVETLDLRGRICRAEKSARNGLMESQ